jgi:hypothetical protein
MERMKSKKVYPLPVELVIQENKYHNLYEIMTQYLAERYEVNQSIQSYCILHKMMVANRDIYLGSRRSLLNKRVRDSFYKFVLLLENRLNDYSANASYFQQVLHGIQKKHITIHVAVRSQGVKKIVIQPWRNVIQSEDKARYYDDRNTFSEVVLDILTGFDLNNIVTVQYHTDIKSFNKLSISV